MLHIFENSSEIYIFDNVKMDIYKIPVDKFERFKDLTDEKLSRLNDDDISINEITDSRTRGDRLVLVVTQTCNLACKYCYAQQGNYGVADDINIMTMETAKNAVIHMFSIFREGVSKIQFFGGEPLINFELIKNITPWIIGYYRAKGAKEPEFYIVTNGTILNDEIMDFFNKYNVTVTISIDGNKKINDTNRIFNNGKGTYDTISSNINTLNAKRKHLLALEMTVNESNIEQFIDSNELVDIQDLRKFKPDMFHIVPVLLSDEERTFDNKELFQESLKQYFVKSIDLSANSIFDESPVNIMKPLDITRNIIHKNPKCNLCSAGIRDFSVGANGDLYPCFTFIGHDEYKIGNVNSEELDNFDKVFGQCRSNTYDSIEKCRKCWAKGVCSGCIGNFYLINGSIDQPIDDLCEVQKSMIEKIIVNCCDYVV